MRVRALFRIPKVYRDSVRFFVGLAVIFDSFVLAATIGHLYQVKRQFTALRHGRSLLFESAIENIGCHIRVGCHIRDGGRSGRNVWSGRLAGFSFSFTVASQLHLQRLSFVPTVADP